MSRFEWVADSARLLKATGEEFDRTQPFKGLRIGTGIHLEPKTAALLMVLRRGGADLVSTGNLNSTQQETVDYLRANGIDVIGGPTADPAEHDRFLRGVLATKPDIILDNGGDLFSRYLEDPYAGLRGGTEETTSGRDPPAPAARPPGDADPRHQRQPDQAVRREHARRRGGHRGVVHPDHQPDHERATGGRVRLRVRRAWRRGLLPRLQLDRVGHRATAGAAAAGAARRLRRPGSRGGAS